MYDFTNKAICCTEWEQVLELCKIAYAQGIEPNDIRKEYEQYFKRGAIYFCAEDNEFGMYSYDVVMECGDDKIDYADFIASPHPQEKVYGC